MTGPRPRQAFTLIELLVVISIIVLLLAILMPALRQARQSAQNAQCLSNKRQMGIGFAAYALDHDGRLMPLSSYANFSAHPAWYQSLARYTLHTDKEVGTSILRCLTFEPIDPNANNRSYAVNYPGVFAHVDPDVTPDPSTLFAGSARLDKLPAYVFLTADFKTTGSYATTPAAFWVSFIYNPDYPAGYWVLNVDTDGDGVLDSAASQIPGLGRYNGLDPRHPTNTANFLFADGSAHSVPIADWARNDKNLWGDASGAYK